MKPRKTAMLLALVGLLLLAFALGMAQSTTQSDKKKTESCCAEGASCCVEGASCCAKDARADKKDSCCCCSGDSCDMDAHHDTKAKHDPKKQNGEGACCKMKQKDTKSKAKQKSA
jgi:hypothetical protein